MVSWWERAHTPSRSAIASALLAGQGLHLGQQRRRFLEFSEVTDRAQEIEPDHALHPPIRARHERGRLAERRDGALVVAALLQGPPLRAERGPLRAARAQAEAAPVSAGAVDVIIDVVGYFQ